MRLVSYGAPGLLLAALAAGCGGHKSSSPSGGAAPQLTATWTQAATLDTSSIAGAADIGWTGPGFNVNTTAQTADFIGGIVPDPASPVGEDVSDRAARYDLAGASLLAGVAVSNTTPMAGVMLLRTSQAVYAMHITAFWPPGPGPSSAMFKLEASGWRQLSASAHEQGYYFVYQGKLYRLLAAHGYITRFSPERGASLEVLNEQNETWDVLSTQNLSEVPHGGVGSVLGDKFIILAGGFYPSQGQMDESQQVITLDLPATLATGNPLVTVGPKHPTGISGRVLFAGGGRVFLLKPVDPHSSTSRYEVYAYDVATNTFARQNGADAPFIIDGYFQVSDNGQPQNGMTYFYRAKAGEIWTFRP